MPKATKNSESTDSSLDCGKKPNVKPRKDPKIKEAGNPNKDSGKDRCSQQTLSVQHIKFPERSKLNVKRQRNLLKIPESRSSSTTAKQRGYDFTSSTNSHFGQMIVTVPERKVDKRSSISGDKPWISESTESIKSSKQLHLTQRDTSQELIGSQHKCSEKQINFHGAEWRQPCKESFVAGAPRKFIGPCPQNYEQLSKMSKARQKFFLTQDPRKVHCLVNPEILRSKEYSKKKEFNTLTKMVKHAQNVCAATASESSEDFICEVIDLENPLQLDFQGLDYSNTYEKDEQDFQNQRNYSRVLRYMERRKVKKETAKNVEDEIHDEAINVPKRYNVRDRNDPEPIIPPKNPPKLGELFRSISKPKNQKVLDEEKEKRRKRYKDLYLSMKERQEKQQQEDERLKRLETENLALNLADVNFKKIVHEIDETIEKGTRKETYVKKPETDKRKFPNTMQETQKFRNILKQKNRIKADKARITKEFFLEHRGKEKLFPEANLEVSSDSAQHSSKDYKQSEQSSDDADNMEVGKNEDKFKLRGFQFKLGSSLRGKFNQSEKLQGTRIEKFCMTREQWLKELAPKKQQIKLDVEKGIQKIRSPDDPLLQLFPPPFGFKPPLAESSTIREYIEKPLGRHYDSVTRKNLKFVQPRLRYSVKKFNLISYRFGDTTKRFSQMKNPLEEEQILKLKTTQEFMAAKVLQKALKNEERKQRRLQLLGIPCRPTKKSRLQTKCENSSSSSDSDWVPKQEDFDKDLENERFRETLSEIRPLRMRGNMPAPKFREPTLRQHPRCPRDYDNQRVPSAIFDKVVTTTCLPYMQKLDEDIHEFANLELKKRPYTKLFEARHHHDHWISTQNKKVDVHYQPNVVKPEITKIKKKSDRQVMENFHVANPPCNQFVDMELTVPQYDIDEMIREHKSKSSKIKIKDAHVIKSEDICHQKDFKFQSRDPKEFEDLDYPGRQEYLQLLKDAREAFEGTKIVNEEEQKEKLYVNKEELLKELEEDLKSIESCLTSLSSSECTNLTNGSGSFLLMEGKEKIPLDFIRKSLVPFEELHRSRFHAVPIDVGKEKANPFQVLPFAGQKKAQLELNAPTDTFFTFTTRLKNGMRLRMDVPVEDVREKLMGQGLNKHKGMVATDIDENYVDLLADSPAIKLFNFKTGQNYIKDALRLKFESMLIQGQMVRTKIYDRLNEQHWIDMQRVKELFEKLFSKWEKREYDLAMAVVYRVKDSYDITDHLKKESTALEREILKINMDIVFIEGHWVRCIMLQNFHYLLGDLEWRVQNDWIHRLKTEEGYELENFEDSIMKRSQTNIRHREKDDAWAIKAYYEEVYLNNNHDNLIVFPNAENFMLGLESLKTNTFILLLEMHFILAIHTEFQNKLETFEDWCAEDLRQKSEYVNRKCAKLYFMSDRARWLNQRVLRFLQEPVKECFDNASFHRDRAVIAEAWRRIVPASMRGSSEQDVYTIDMVAMMSEVLMDLINKFELIPMDITYQLEKKQRKMRAYVRKQSLNAYHIERRIDLEMKKVVRNLQPAFKKPKRSGKLPRYHLKKRVKSIKAEEQKITKNARFFFRAFNEDGALETATQIRDSMTQMAGVQEQIVPFYFDHFLKLNGYTPNYNFKTQVELRDGPEVNRFQIKTIIPEVLDRMDQWEMMKKKVMEDNIAQNPKMYIDVMT